jgi:hypothetical protein
VRPSCLQSEFCAIRGTGEDQLYFFERVGRHVLDAAEELGTLILGSAPHVANEIVDPQKISLVEGKLSDAGFSKVLHIRFRKNPGTPLHGVCRAKVCEGGRRGS